MELNQDKYQVLKIPVNYEKSFLDFSQEELLNYKKWFFDIKESRLTFLCKFLFDNLECLDEKNLTVIDVFLINSVSVVNKSKKIYLKEEEEIPKHLKGYAKPDDYLLDERSISICFDLGIYLGELIIQLDKKITWVIEKNIEFVDFGQPILIKKGCNFNVNPFAVMKNMAAKIYKKKYREFEIISVFQTWKKCFRI